MRDGRADPVCGPVLAIKGIVDGRTFWIEGGKPRNGLLVLGTYKAHLVQEENHKGYKYNRRYELIYPDGERETFSVSGETK